MIRAQLKQIPEQAVLMYLSYRGSFLPEEIREDLQRCSQIILETARPRAVWREFDWNPDGPLPGTSFTPAGQDIRNLLRDSKKVILFGATLGTEVDQLLRREQVRNMGEAVILDACASAAIENVCDNLCEDFAREADGFLTDRFSPGYGDFPFSQQPDFCQVLDMARRIGVCLSPTGLMIPQKSVTALLGIADTPQPRRFRGCETCSAFEHCTYRKGGTTCGRI